MNRWLKLTGLLLLAASISGFSISGAVGEGMKLAVECKTDEAVKVLSDAQEKRGLTGALAILELEAVLRDAGRDEEADAIQAKRESQQAGMTEKQKDEAEKAILKTVDNIQTERKNQTGSATCP
jgi:hypothetical protein